MKLSRKSMVYYISTAVFSLLFASILIVSASAQNSSGDEADNASIYTDYILNVANIEVSEHDQIIRRDSDGCVSLAIQRAFPVTVNYRGEEFTAYVTGGSVEEAIKSVGIPLSGAEDVSPNLFKEVTPGTYIEIKADNFITITCDGETQSFYTKGGTVSDVLDGLGITLSKDDEVSPSLDSEIKDDTEIVVKRVEFKKETKKEVIEYGFVTEKTSSMKDGTSKIKQEGINGEKEVTSMNKYVDGELVESKVISEKTTKKTQDQIKLVGTKKSSSGSNTNSSNGGGASMDNAAGYFYDYNGKKVYYQRKLTGSSTAYSYEAGSMTATGVPVYQGGVAVNPNVIPYGSKLYIVSTDGSKVYGYATAVDTGGALMSGYVLVDVFYPSESTCNDWGRRQAYVYVLT